MLHLPGRPTQNDSNEHVEMAAVCHALLERCESFRKDLECTVQASHFIDEGTEAQERERDLQTSQSLDCGLPLPPTRSILLPTLQRLSLASHPFPRGHQGH